MNGRSYRIDLRSDGHPSIDPWIVDIYDKRGDKITRPVDLGHPVFAGYADHDSGPGNAARVIYPATETGNHFIKVASRGSASQRQGAWHLQVTEASAPYYDDFTADTSTTGTVTVDGTVSGWIDATPSWYDAGDTGGPSITVSGTSREPGWTYDDSVRTNCHEATGDGIKLDGNTCDRDWFAVNLTTNLSYKLQLVSGTNLLIAGVYNNTGALIPNSGSIIDSIVFMTDEDPSESVTVVFVDDFVVFRASRTGTHYIAVTGRSSCSAAPGCTGRYTLSVTQQ